MSSYESSVDYSKVENDEIDHISEIDNLELARRGDDNLDNTILTITMADDHNLEIVTRNNQFPCCIRIGSVPLAFYLLLLSTCLLIVTVILAHVLIKQGTKQPIKCLLLILRSVGVFTFIGQLSHFVAWKVSSLNSQKLYCERLRHKMKNEITQSLKRFITCMVFDEVAVRNYIQRVNIMSEEERLSSIINFMDSSDLNDVVSDHLSRVYESPEGPFVEMIGADKEELSSHCNYVLQQAVCKVLKKFMKEVSAEDWRRPETIRSHIVEIVNLQLQSLNWKYIAKLLKSISSRQFDRQSLIIFICMILAGCIIEAVNLSIPLHSF